MEHRDGAADASGRGATPTTTPAAATATRLMRPEQTRSAVALLRRDVEKGGGDDGGRSGDDTRRRAVAAAIAMGVVGLLILAALVVLAVSPALVTGKPRSYWGARRRAQAAQQSGVPQEPVLRPDAPGLMVMDVDAGADDAIAILLTLRQEELAKELGVEGPRLLAITCTHGNTALENVQRNVLKTLHLAGRLDIPVYSGAAGSIIYTPTGDNYFGTDGFGDFIYPDAPDPEKYLQKDHAVNALISLVKEYPGKITLIATGPLSNLGLAIRMYPDFMNDLQQLVIMGGSSSGVGNIKPATEFNFFLDPEANYIVFNSSTNASKPIYLLPWEAAGVHNLIDMEWRLDVLGNVKSKCVDFLNNAERKSLEADAESGLWISADPITAALLLKPELITSSEKHHVDAEFHGEFARGAIFVDYNDRLSPQNTVIINTFDVQRYKELLLTNLS